MEYNTDGFKERTNYIRMSNELNQKKRGMLRPKQSPLRQQVNKRETVNNAMNFEMLNNNQSIANELRHASNNPNMMHNNFRG